MIVCRFYFDSTLDNLVIEKSYWRSTKKGWFMRKTPQSAIMTGWRGLSLPSVGVFSTVRTTFVPSRTLPKTTCLPSSQGVWTVVMKN